MKAPPPHALKKFIKVAGAALVAFVILNSLCLVYYNNPIQNITYNDVTDLRGEPDYYYRNMQYQGWGYGKTNNEGFYNIEDFTGQQVDILIIGDSHMEAAHLSQSKTTYAILNRMKSITEAHNTKLIFLYHPAGSLKLYKDGTIHWNGTIHSGISKEDLQILKKACDEVFGGGGSIFLDMTDVFLREYNEHHILPYGFANTRIGYGHLNQHGHRMIANALYNFMEEQN